ncbi:MAG TPA: T9SS type A sorting domain-containing protein [Cyclobacteriaceae bacterium]|nr:T9SS type A sorting domain-containing protein [Cyclobacteriaceae bacterium]HRF33964.1 T9SS type A sorting domain-containing protein [Cyclobacteriaceae bacterium]
MKKTLLPYVVALVLVFSSQLSFGQRFWVAGGPSNWNNTANWSTTSGGAGGASVPGPADAVTFNANGLGNCTLDVAANVAGITVNGYTGTIDLNGFNLTTTGTNTFTTGTINNGGAGAAVTLNTTGTSTFSGTTFGANVNGSTGRIFFNGSVFNGSVTVTKTANNLDTSTGGNTFSGSVTLTNGSTNGFRMGGTNPDIFNGTLALVSGNSGALEVAFSSAANQLNNNVTATYNATGLISVGNGGGTATLAATRTISVAGFGGAGCGNLTLARLTQAGGTAQNISLGGNDTATLTLGPASSFSGTLTSTTPSIIFNSSTFQAVTVTKTGSQVDNCRGGNTFNGIMTVNNQGGDFMMGSNAADAGDTWNANAIFNNTGGYRIRVGEDNAGNIFQADATFINTSATDIQSRIQISRFGTASVTFNGTTTFTNNATAGDIHISYASGSTTTFNGPVVLNSSAGLTGVENWIGQDGDVTLNGTLTITSSDNVFLGRGSSIVNMTAGNSIALGGGGFTGNELSIRNFTQAGSAAMNLALTGATTMLRVTNSTIGGNATFSSPQFSLANSTFNGAASIEKTGATDNSSSGNTFNGATTITHSGDNEIYFGNGAADTFNGPAVFNNTGSYRIRIAYNHNGATTTFANNLTLNSNKSGGADIWSFLVGELTNTNVSVGGDLIVNCAGSLRSDHRFLNGPGSTLTLTGNLIINNTNTHANTIITMGVNGTATYNGDITLTNTGGSNGITFNSGASSSSTQAAGRALSIAGGFDSGDLSLHRFTRLGSEPTTLLMGGTTTILRVGPASVFGGTANLQSPRLFLDGVAISGTATLEKTGASNDAGAGGNVFSGVTTITNSGSGYLMLGSVSADQFLSNATFNNTGSYRIYFAHNHNGQTTTFSSDLTLNSNKSGGSDPWSFFIAEGTNAAFSVGGAFNINCDGAIQSNYRILQGGGTSATFNGPVNINVTNSAPGTVIQMGESGTSTYNSNITVSNSGGAAGITFNGQTTASSTLNGVITAGPFPSGGLNLYRFTQIGALAENLTLTGSSTLRVGPNSSFDGNVNFVSPRLYLNGATYNGSASLEKTGSGDDAGNGNNVFNSTTTLVNSGSGYLMTANASPDVFNGPLTVSNSGSNWIFLAHNVAGNQFNNNIIVNNTGSALGIIFSNNATGAATFTGGTISTGGSGFTTGQLRLRRFSQVGATNQNLTLTGSALLWVGPTSSFDGDVNFVAPQLLLNGATYNGTAYLEKNGTNNDAGDGGNIFNQATTLVNSGNGYLMSANNSPDVFNGNLVVTNSGSSTIRLSENSAGNQYNGNVELNSTFGGGIYFGNSANGTSTLAATRTIGVGGSGVISGDIRLIRFTQVGPTAQTLNLTGIAILTLGPSSSFGGNIDFRAPQLFINGTTFDGIAYLEKTGAVNNVSNGGNLFNGITSIVNSGSGGIYSAETAPDIFNTDLTITNTGSGIISLARNVAGNQFNGDITFNSTLGSGGIYISSQASGSSTMASGGSLLVGGLGYSSGYLSLRRFTQLGADPQTLVLTGTALLQLGPSTTFNGAVDFRSAQFELNGTTFNGTTYLEKTGATNNDSNGGNEFNGVTTIANSGAGFFRFALNALDTFNGDLTLTNTGSSSIRMADNVPGTLFNGNITVNSTFGGGVYFSENGGGTATLAAGRTISVGGIGFSLGELHLRRFTQTGATPQTLLLSGTAALVLGPSISIDGAADFRAPQLYINGGVFNGDAFLEKNGASPNTGIGNTTFHGTTTIQVSSTGLLRTNGGNTFNGVTNLVNSGSNDLLLELTTASVYNNTVNMTNTGSSYIRPAYLGNTTFNGDITVNSTSGTGIYFSENAGGSATLASGRTISVGGTGFTAGELRLQRFTQFGTTAQNLVLTGVAAVRVGPSSTWNGSVAVTSPSLFLDGATFNNTNSFTKTGASTDASIGGNIFVGVSSFSNSGTGIFRLGNVNVDEFIGSTTFNQASGTIQPTYNSASNFYNHVTVDGASPILFGANNGTIVLAGGAAQNINKAGTASPVFRRLTLNKSGNTATLNTDASVTTNATFTSGVLFTSATNYLNFANDATSTGGSNTSHIDGPVRKTGNDAFSFPTGDGGFYRPISISAPTNATHYFTAEYFKATHAFGGPATYPAGIVTVSTCEYWMLDRNPAVGGSNVSVTLSWNTPDCIGPYITNPANLRVVRWDGAAWVNHGNGGTTGNATAGTVISAGLITSFSPITLGSSGLDNPLPIELIHFNAVAENEKVNLNWVTASELNNDFFTVQHSTDGVEFASLGIINGQGTTQNSTSYDFVDSNPMAGVNYYRLKQTDFDGTSTYSNIIAVNLNLEWLLYPNPVTYGNDVSINKKGDYAVYNNLGMLVMKISDANKLNISSLAPGIYTVRSSTGAIRRLVVK